jgi:hypothetical protein
MENACYQKKRKPNFDGTNCKNVLLGFMGHPVRYLVLTTLSRAPQVQVVINAITVTGETLMDTCSQWFGVGNV